MLNWKLLLLFLSPFFCYSIALVIIVYQLLVFWFHQQKSELQQIEFFARPYPLPAATQVPPFHWVEVVQQYNSSELRMTIVYRHPTWDLSCQLFVSVLLDVQLLQNTLIWCINFISIWKCQLTVRCITHSLLRIASSFRARCFASDLAGHPGLWNWQSTHLICPSCTVPIRGETEISQASTRRYAQHFSSNFFLPYFVSRFISSLLILESWTPRFGPNPWDVEGWFGGEAEDLQASWGWKEPVSNVFECYKLYVILWLFVFRQTNRRICKSWWFMNIIAKCCTGREQASTIDRLDLAVMLLDTYIKQLGSNRISRKIFGEALVCWVSVENSGLLGIVPCEGWPGVFFMSANVSQPGIHCPTCNMPWSLWIIALFQDEPANFEKSLADFWALSVDSLVLHPKLFHTVGWTSQGLLLLNPHSFVMRSALPGLWKLQKIGQHLLLPTRWTAQDVLTRCSIYMTTKHLCWCTLQIALVSQFTVSIVTKIFRRSCQWQEAQPF